MKEPADMTDSEGTRGQEKHSGPRADSDDLMLAVVIPADPDEPARVETVPTDHSQRSATYRTWVRGRLEVVHLFEPRASLYINEEHVLREMPLNPRATALAWLHCPGFRGRDVIHGPAFVVGPAQRNGEDTSVPDDLLHLVSNVGLYQVQEGLDAVPTGWRVVAYHRTWLAAYRTAMLLGRNVGLARVVPSAEPETLMQWIAQREEALPEPGGLPSVPEVVDILSCSDSDDLAFQILQTHLRAGHLFSVRDLGLLNLADEGEEWLALRSGRAVRIPPLRSLITDGRFTNLVGRLLKATAGQLGQGEY